MLEAAAQTPPCSHSLAGLTGPTGPTALVPYEWKDLGTVWDTTPQYDNYGRKQLSIKVPANDHLPCLRHDYLHRDSTDSPSSLELLTLVSLAFTVCTFWHLYHIERLVWS
jgi:hypothetical protein